jgi:hypothetical protein
VEIGINDRFGQETASPENTDGNTVPRLGNIVAIVSGQHFPLRGFTRDGAPFDPTGTKRYVI